MLTIPRSWLLFYAWFGAINFVLALGYFVYFYITLTPEPINQSLFSALLTNLGLFGLFATHHSVMARSGIKRWLKLYLKHDIERATYVWLASILFFITCLLWRDLPGMVYSVTGWLYSLGLVIQCTGLAITVLAASVLDPLELAGIRQIMKTHYQRESSESVNPLRIRGVYRLVRHPIYLGWVLFVFGTPNMSVTQLTFATISTCYIVLAIPWEESSMLESSGESYRRYQQAVRWKMVPGIW